MPVRTVKIVSLVSSETWGLLCANPARAVSNPARLKTIVSRKRCPRKLLLDFGRSGVELKIVYEVAIGQVKQEKQPAPIRISTSIRLKSKVRSQIEEVKPVQSRVGFTSSI